MLYVILLAAILIFAIVLYDKPFMKIQFKQGDVSAYSGHVDKDFLHQCKSIVKGNPFDGTVKVYRSRKQYRMKFSKGIPNKTRHILRSALTGGKPHAKKR
ncbi:DUF3634 family protein [Vibrio rarus]|uniref:DUF3634 family protein n=1 Tax=Vibrio rarus TaxID=413403 RepID=UPI0021C4674E|nr:DUF3634 family protein [Vibrio rarus]